jgi:hypothetical protein
MARFHWSAALGAVLVAAGVVVSCQPATTPGTASLLVSVNPRSIANNGQTTTVSVAAEDQNNNPGTGSVSLVLSPSTGMLGTNLVALDGGTGQTTFSCNGCVAGPVKITGTWSSVSSPAATVTVTSSGADAGPGQDGGSDGGNMGMGNGTALSLTASKPQIILGIGDTANIVGVLTQLDGGPLSGQTLQFSTNLGQLTGLTGIPGPTATSVTGANGSATVVFGDNGDAGLATITATHAASGATAMLQEAIVAVKSITWLSTTCSNMGNTVPCTFMGVQGTGFQEQAQVSFKVIDALGDPVVGATVTFSLLQAPAGVTLVATGTTDSTGTVFTTVSSGPQIGAFSVLATVIAGIQTQSPTIGVVGVYPTNASMTFSCAQVNIPAWVANVPPAAYSIQCSISLADRFNNPVGTGAQVFFKTESGTVPNEVTTVAFDPNNPSNPAVGTATIQFQTQGGTWPPEPVDPLPALDSTQQPFPAPRDLEPSYLDTGGVIRNPRDGLITIMAYVTGEKWFSDLNNNGHWDPGEPFVDQWDPYVDSNDDNIREPNEQCIGSGPDGGCQGPTGTGGGGLNVWIDTRVVVTDRPAAGFALAPDAGPPPHIGLSPVPFVPACPGGLQPGGSAGVHVFAPDFQINKPYGMTTFSSQFVPSSTTMQLTESGSTLDGYGMGYQRLLVDTSNSTQCNLGVTPVCQWETFFTTWGAGDLESGIVVTDTNTTGVCVNNNLSTSVTCLSVTLVYPSDGPGGAN